MKSISRHFVPARMSRRGRNHRYQVRCSFFAARRRSENIKKKNLHISRLPRTWLAHDVTNRHRYLFLFFMSPIGTSGWLAHPRLLITPFSFCLFLSPGDGDSLTADDGDCGDTLTYWWWWHEYIRMHFNIFASFISLGKILCLQMCRCYSLSLPLLINHSLNAWIININNVWNCRYRSPRTLHGIKWIYSASRYHALFHAPLQSFRHFLGNFCDRAVSLYWPPRTRNYRANLHLHAGTSAVPFANSIVTNDLHVKFRKCWPLPPHPLPLPLPLCRAPCHVKPRIVCKRNDAAFAAGELLPLIQPAPPEPNPLCLIHSLITPDPP